MAPNTRIPTAILIGAARGIGAAAARALANRRYNLFLCDILENAGFSTCAELNRAYGIEAEFHPLDVADADGIANAVATAKARFGRIDALFNNVGIVRYGAVADLSLEDWDYVQKVNLRAQFVACKHVLPHMIADGGGAIVNTASVLAHGNQKLTVAYATSKAGVLSLTRSVAVEYAHMKIRCNSISPGTIDTEIIRDAAASFGEDVESTIAKWGRMHPLGRLGTPDEVGELVAFLMSEKAGFITGTDFAVDGGIRAGLYNN